MENQTHSHNQPNPHMAAGRRKITLTSKPVQLQEEAKLKAKHAWLFLGLKTERELYPRNLIDKGVRKMVYGEEIKERGQSLELEEAIHESFEKDFLLKAQIRSQSIKTVTIPHP